MAQYLDLADALRARIVSGEFPLGSRLPSISEIQDQYDVRSLGTVRAAQQLLVDEGLIDTRQGVGAFVIGTESLKKMDVYAELVALRDRLTTVLSAIESHNHHSITIDLSEPHVSFVLTDALREWADRQRERAEDEPDLDPDARREWAAAADRVRARIEAEQSNG
ncbi:winged helix-turn-helix domain-containing protein [Nocardia vaccinii]|uniref:winged helix-turn-helix domain-containing protein n=1 Tax=Nocardia vaccinii TaxID=1822 RepID=UPI00082E91FE|nr:winged helix-turn-helix domain-containing protein [Nocardia vaccinii]